MKCIIRKIKYWFQKRTRGWSDDECWNLDITFLEWINSRFKKYKEKAGKIVDLEFHKFKYKGKTYTQLELINKVIALSDYVLFYEDDLCLSNYYKEEVEEIIDIFKLIYWSMWW